MTIKIWLDDIRPFPSPDWVSAKSVNQVKQMIKTFQNKYDSLIFVLDLDHDLGDYAKDGGDAIKLLDWIEAKEIDTKNFIFKIHTANPVGRENMLRIIRKNRWREK